MSVVVARSRSAFTMKTITMAVILFSNRQAFCQEFLYGRTFTVEPAMGGCKNV